MHDDEERMTKSGKHLEQYFTGSNIKHTVHD